MADVTHLKDLKPDPRNARRHNPRNVGMLEDALNEVGAARSIVIDENGVVLAGNATIEAAANAGIERVQVVDADGETIIAVRRSGLTPEQKTRLALFDNRIGDLSEFNPGVLAELQADNAALLDGLFRDDELKELLNHEADLLASLAAVDDDPLDFGALTARDVPDALWPSDNEWGIPTLDLHWQADAVDLPVVTWGSMARTSKMRGTWLFYTEDERFEALWHDPSGVVNSGCVNAVEPNFSVYDQMPRAIALYNTYRKRWMARYWQSKGVRVFVDLNVAEHGADINLMGVPQGWRAYATRGYADRMDATEREFERACERAGSDDVLFLVYGGGKAVMELCQRRAWVHIDEHMNRAKRGEMTHD